MLRPAASPAPGEPDERSSLTAKTVQELCPKCGLCCNGVLFTDVKLGKTDDLEKLISLGLDLKKRGTTWRFLQPCSALCGRLCTIYRDRPSQCRAFECALVKNVASGRLTAGAALKKIERASRLAERIRELLRTWSGAQDELSLRARYVEMLKEPVDLSIDKKRLQLRDSIASGMNRLIRFIQNDFLS